MYIIEKQVEFIKKPTIAKCILDLEKSVIIISKELRIYIIIKSLKPLISKI